MKGSAMPDLRDLFIDETIRRFDEEDLPRLEEAVGTVPEDKLWWRPHRSITSVGNLLIHLEGNTRQWFLGALGGGSMERARGAEFAATEGGSATELCRELRDTVEAAYPILRSLDEPALARSYTIQGFEVTGLAAVYHVLEHFGWHTGQIVWIAKATAGSEHGLAFYDDAALEGL